QNKPQDVSDLEETDELRMFSFPVLKLQMR
ncbi:hypothetical protein AVEN_177052-1, partial [Araneus ventricosus]